MKELKRNNCEGYYEWRFEKTDGQIKQSTVEGEQVTINSMMKWLYKQNETYIDGFDFKKLKKDGKVIKCPERRARGSKNARWGQCE